LQLHAKLHAADRVTLDELAAALDCTYRNAVLVLKRMADRGWIAWSPERGRGRRSRLRFIAPPEEIALEAVLEASERRSGRRADGRTPQAVLTASAAGTGAGLDAGAGGTLPERLLAYFGHHAEMRGRRQIDTLRLPLRHPLHTLDPLYMNLLAESFVASHVFDGLVRRDGVSGEIRPHLAHAWETDAERLTWTFYLRKMVPFHDGTVLTAEDVAFSLERLMRSNRSMLYSFVIRTIRSVKAIHPLVVQVVLAEPNELFLPFLGTSRAAILSQHASFRGGAPAEGRSAADGRGTGAGGGFDGGRGGALGGGSDGVRSGASDCGARGSDVVASDGPAAFRPIGTGPFKVTQMNEKVCVLEAFDRYFLGRVHLDRAEIVHVPWPQDEAADGTEIFHIIPNAARAEQRWSRVQTAVTVRKFVTCNTLNPGPLRDPRARARLFACLADPADAAPADSPDARTALALVTIAQYQADAARTADRLRRCGYDCAVQAVSPEDFKRADVRLRADLLLFSLIRDRDEQLRLFDLYTAMCDHMEPRMRSVIERKLRHIRLEREDAERSRLFAEIEEALTREHLLHILSESPVQSAYLPSVRGITFSAHGWVDLRHVWFPPAGLKP
jgi:MarR-like DNA-binding transcriptional regulator SgrR of sgrS sRNA